MKRGLVLSTVVCAIVIGVGACSSSPRSAEPSSPRSIPMENPSSTAADDAASSVNDGITGIGATLEAWDKTHEPNHFFDAGNAYGYDPSLPTSISSHGAVYVDVQSSDRITSYILNLHPLSKNAAIARVRQEIPRDATIAWELPLDKCYRIAFNSKVINAESSGTVIAQLSHIQDDGAQESNPATFNQADIETGGPAKPNPDFGC